MEGQATLQSSGGKHACKRYRRGDGLSMHPGYGANRRVTEHGSRDLSHDRPMMLSLVDTEEKLRAYFPILDDMVQQGLVVLSDVDIIK
jgi:PII-like signaling protein